MSCCADYRSQSGNRCGDGISPTSHGLCAASIKSQVRAPGLITVQQTPLPPPPSGSGRLGLGENHDLQKLMVFLDERGLTVQDFTPARSGYFLATFRHTPSSRACPAAGVGRDGRRRPVVVGADLQSDIGSGLVVARVPPHLRTV